MYTTLCKIYCLYVSAISPWKGYHVREQWEVKIVPVPNLSNIQKLTGYLETASGLLLSLLYSSSWQLLAAS